MKQVNLFGKDFENKQDSKYTSKIKTPEYEPKNKKPHILELCNKSKTNRLLNEIQSANITIEEKNFLIDAARRHNVFNYSKIADYYAHSSREMQELMESSALVIIDFEKSIKLGYTKLSDKLLQTFLKEPTNEK